MRQRHFAQREHQRGRLPGLFGEAIRRAHGKHQRKRIPVLIVAQKFRQLFRGKLLAASVQQHQRVPAGTGIPRAQFQKRRFVFDRATPSTSV